MFIRTGGVVSGTASLHSAIYGLRTKYLASGDASVKSIISVPLGRVHNVGESYISTMSFGYKKYTTYFKFPAVKTNALG